MRAVVGLAATAGASSPLPAFEALRAALLRGADFGDLRPAVLVAAGFLRVVFLVAFLRAVLFRAVFLTAFLRVVFLGADFLAAGFFLAVFFLAVFLEVLPAADLFLAFVFLVADAFRAVVFLLVLDPDRARALDFLRPEVFLAGVMGAGR